MPGNGDFMVFSNETLRKAHTLTIPRDLGVDYMGKEKLAGHSSNESLGCCLTPLSGLSAKVR